jgi:hypothetical protein
MSTSFSMARDINGYNGFGIDFCDDSYSMIMAPNVAQSIVVPINYKTWIAIFTYTPGSSVWVANNATAAVPVGAVSITTSQLNPTARRVRAGDTLSLITSDATNDQVSVCFYWID